MRTTVASVSAGIWRDPRIWRSIGSRLTVSVLTVARSTVGASGLRRETPTETAATQKAIDFASGDQASSPISKPSSSVYRVIWRAFAPWDGSATQMLLRPFALNTHATAAPVGAASMSDANGACITSLSV